MMGAHRAQGAIDVVVVIIARGVASSRVIASREGGFEIARETLDDDASIDRDRIESNPFH